MAAKVGGETVKSPGEVVISGYATVPDISKKATPDIKRPGESKLVFIDLAEGKNRLGGSALAQAFSQIGDDSPDVDNPSLLTSAFNAVQRMLDDNLVLACHDRSDGGLITTLAEMAMAANCGISVQLAYKEAVIPQLFCEELGLVVECLAADENLVRGILDEHGVPFVILGTTERERQVVIRHGGRTALNIDTADLLSWWEATSDRLEQEQMNPVLAREQAQYHNRSGLRYQLTFEPGATPPEILDRTDKPRVAIIREEGSNGDREMASAFFWAGFEPWDIVMTDLAEERITLDEFRGVVFVGGFAYADVLDSAKGWAGIIRFNPKLHEMFHHFFDRQDTFSLAICNGCQLMAFLGILPWPGIP
jgi:phosphoribosylformylglycinamidine synthase